MCPKREGWARIRAQKKQSDPDGMSAPRANRARQQVPGAGEIPALLLPSPPGTSHRLELSLDPRHRILRRERYWGQLPWGGFSHSQVSIGGKRGKRSTNENILRSLMAGALWNHRPPHRHSPKGSRELSSQPVRAPQT